MARLLIVPALLVATLPAAAQAALLSVETESRGPAVLGPDLDGDRVRDLLLGDPGSYTLNRPGRVEARSGADGTLLRTWTGEEVYDHFGSSLTTLADLDGDDFPDLAIGAPGRTAVAGHRPYLHVVSGASGALLYRLEGAAETSFYATALASLGDVDGDGAGDLAIGSTGFLDWSTVGTQPGFAEVVSGATGTLLWRTADTGPGQPVSVTRHPDVDGDGSAELVVGFTAEERVEVRAGADGAVLRTVHVPAGVGFGYSTGFGAAVAAGRDLDGDDRPDLAVGAPYEALSKPNVGSYEGSAYSGAVYVVSGASGAVVQRLTAVPGEIAFGNSVALIGDQDGDGVDDLVTGNGTRRAGCCKYFPGTVRAYSARGTAPIFALQPESYGLLHDAGDWDGDGRGDFVLGGRRTQFWPPPTKYAAEIISPSLLPPWGGQACAGMAAGACAPWTFSAGEPRVSGSSTFTLQAWGWPAGARGLLLLGTGAELETFGPGQLCVSRIFRRLPALPAGGSTTGSCSQTLTTTLPPELLKAFEPGTILHAQFYSPDATWGPGYSGVISFFVWP